MLKKTVMIALSLMMLLSVMSVSAEIVTEPSGKVIYTDDFNDNTAGRVNNNASKAYTSDVIEPAAYVAAGYGHMVAEAGPDGSMAMQFQPRSDDRYVNTRELAIYTSSAMEYEFSFDFNVSSNAYALSLVTGGDKGGGALFKLTNDGKIQKKLDGGSFTDSGVTYSADTWYHVVVVAKGTQKYGWISDTNGNSVYSEAEVTNTRLSPFTMSSGTSGSITLNLDNLKLVEYNPAVIGPGVKASTVTDGAENVPRNVPLEFEFDQSVTLDDTLTTVVSLGKVNGDGSVIPVTGAALEVLSGNRKAKITYTGLLERKTKYAVTLTNLKNGSGLYCSETYYFTTEDLHLWEPVVVSSIGTKNPDTGLTPVTFIIEDGFGYPAFDGSALVMVHQDGKMVSCDMQALPANAIGSCTVSFDLGTVPGGADVSVVLMDCLNVPIPLATGTITAP